MGIFRDELEFHLQGGHTAEEIEAHNRQQKQKRAEMMSGMTNMAMQRHAAKEMGAYTSAGVSDNARRERGVEEAMYAEDSEQRAIDMERRARDLEEKAAEMHDYAMEIRAQGKRQRERGMRFIREAYGDEPSIF